MSALKFSRFSFKLQMFNTPSMRKPLIFIICKIICVSCSFCNANICFYSISSKFFYTFMGDIMRFFHCLRYLSPDGACVFAIQLHELWGKFAA